MTTSDAETISGLERRAPGWAGLWLERLLAFAVFHGALVAVIELTSLELAVCIFTGLAAGQAFALLLDRFYSGAPVLGRLYLCTACRSRVTPALAFPLVGYIWRMGRCPDCRTALPLRAVALPAGGAALFGISYLVFDDVGAALLGGFFSTVFLALTITDLERRVLPNRIVYPAVVLAGALAWGWPETSVTQVFAGAGVGVAIAAGLLLFSLPFGGEAFGMGDAKMIVLIGIVVGFPAVIPAVLAGTLAAGLVAGVLVLTRIKTLSDYIPHGPFLALGAVLALIWTQTG